MAEDAAVAASLRMTNTHLYKGACGQAAAPLPRRRDGTVPCMVEFSDGASVPGEVAKSGPERWRLSLPAHVTARGAAIGAKVWTLGKEEAAEGLPSAAAVRIIERLG